MNTGGCLGHRWGRNGDSCVAMGQVTRTAGILACIASLIGPIRKFSSSKAVTICATSKFKQLKKP